MVEHRDTYLIRYNLGPNALTLKTWWSEPNVVLDEVRAEKLIRKINPHIKARIEVTKIEKIEYKS